MHQLADLGEEKLGKKGLETEDDVEVAILRLCFFKAANNEDRKRAVGFAELADELRAAHAGHSVVRNDEADFVGKFAFLELLESSLRVQGGDHELVCPAENRLAGSSLDCIVINE